MTGADRRDEVLKREAVTWVRRLTSGEATTADAAALKRWSAQSPAHAAAFAAASRLWKDLEAAGRSLQFSGKASASPSSVAFSRRALIGGGLAAASAAGVYAVVRPPLELWPSLGELTADYRTSTGEQRNVVLFDDVSVRMNTRTSIAVRALDNVVDKLELLNGEASFSTRGRGGRSLAVRAADRWIMADAAQFEVRYLNSLVCVTCLDGAVTVERDGEAVSVAAGQQIRYDPSGLGLPQAVDTEVASAWQRGLLIFRFTPLSEVVDEVNRYRPGRIIVTNAELGRTPVSGRFRIDNLEEILTRIEQAFGAKVRSLPGGLVLLS